MPQRPNLFDDLSSAFLNSKRNVESDEALRQKEALEAAKILSEIQRNEATAGKTRVDTENVQRIAEIEDFQTRRGEFKGEVEAPGLARVAAGEAQKKQFEDIIEPDLGPVVGQTSTDTILPDGGLRTRVEVQRRDLDTEKKIADINKAKRVPKSDEPDPLLSPESQQFLTELTASNQVTAVDARMLAKGGAANERLLQSMRNSGFLFLPNRIKTGIIDVGKTRGIIQELAEKIEQINALPNSEAKEKAIKSFGLEVVTGGIASQLVRGFGDNRPSDLDVERVSRLIPGWIQSNFAPSFAEEVLNTTFGVLDRMEQGLIEGSTLRIPSDPEEQAQFLKDREVRVNLTGSAPDGVPGQEGALQTSSGVSYEVIDDQ